MAKLETFSFITKDHTAKVNVIRSGDVATEQRETVAYGFHEISNTTVIRKDPEKCNHYLFTDNPHEMAKIMEMKLIILNGKIV